jgi:hypothetical protein
MYRITRSSTTGGTLRLTLPRDLCESQGIEGGTHLAAELPGKGVDGTLVLRVVKQAAAGASNVVVVLDPSIEGERRSLRATVPIAIAHMVGLTFGTEITWAALPGRRGLVMKVVGDG